MTDVQNGDAQKPGRLFVGVAIGEYASEHLAALPRATKDVGRLEERLAGDGFMTAHVIDATKSVVQETLEAELATGRLSASGDVLVLLWTGHAKPDPDQASLLVFATDDPHDSPAATTAAQIAKFAARTAASQLLVLFDACYSGQGVFEAAEVCDRVARGLADRRGRWAGVVAACQDYERAVDGAFVDKLLELLDKGPRDPALRLRWSSYQAGLRGDDLIDALVKEWDQERQLPKQASFGDPWLMFANPLYRAGAPDRIVEHLLWAARGGAEGDQGTEGDKANWFTGRENELRKLVSWLKRQQPGLCIITGPAGCGKSALAGRIVSLSNPDERREILDSQGLPPPDLDPGEKSVYTHLQARGMTLETCSQLLGEALGVQSSGTANEHDVLSWARAHQGPPPVIVIDGLDEASSEGFRIAERLLAELSASSQLIVASRDLPAVQEDRLRREHSGSEPAGSLLQVLGPPALTIDLSPPADGEDRDIGAYTVARLSRPDGKPRHATMDPQALATEVQKLAAQAARAGREGGFLLARVLTSQLMARAVDTSARRWQEQLATSVEQAFEQDLVARRPLERDGEELPYAGRELLTALAYSYGPGLPADDLWPMVASELSPTGTRYQRLDAFWALDEHRRYITASGLDGQAVYRLHYRLGASLRVTDSDEAPRLVASAALATYESFLALGHEPQDHRYLWHFAWLHAVDAGSDGIERLERLAERHNALIPDVPRALTVLGIRYSDVGRRADAVAPTERAVDIYEALAQDNPAFLNDLASSLNNLGNRYSQVGRRADAVAPTERAVDIYEALAQDNPAFLNDLAGALNNLGACYSQVGRRADAVAPTERAVEIREALAQDNPAFLNDLASSLNNLGNHYSDVGRRADAVAPTERAVDIYEALAQDNPAFLNDLAGALNNLGNHYNENGDRDAGEHRWNSALMRFAGSPRAGIVLRISRARGEDHGDAKIDDLLEALELDSGEDPTLSAQLHAAIRRMRHHDPERFDTRWRSSQQHLPTWRLLDDDILQAAIDWINTPTWGESKQHLENAADRLLTPHGEAALVELLLATANSPAVTEHQRILDSARRHGIDEPYRPLLILDTVNAWRDLDEFDASAQFLRDHQTALTTPDALQTLAGLRDHLRLGLALLARAEHIERAYELLRRPDRAHEALATARQTAGDLLHATATLALAIADTPDSEALAAVHLAIAHTLAGNDEQAAAIVDQLDLNELDTTSLIHAISDAITYHATHAPALATLIRQITLPE